MARPGISYEEVAAVADALTAEGQKATIQTVRERLGKGSPNTIHRNLTAWREARPQRPASMVELPASLASAIASELERAASMARAEIENRLVQVQAEAAELGLSGEALERERDELIEQVVHLTSARDTLAGRTEEQGKELARALQEIERERQAAELARVSAAQIRNQVDLNAEKLVEQTQLLDKLRAELERESQGRIVAEQAAAVLQAKLEALHSRLAEAEATVQQQSRDLERESQGRISAEQAVAVSRAKLEAMQQLAQDLELARQESRKASEEAAELRGRLAQIQKSNGGE